MAAWCCSWQSTVREPEVQQRTARRRPDVCRLGYDVWDADNHLYEPVARTPVTCRSATKGDPLRRRQRIADKLEILGKVGETIPNPTYVVIPTPGAWTEYPREQPRGAEPARARENHCLADARARRFS
jgi:hypothetical protein